MNVNRWFSICATVVMIALIWSNDFNRRGKLKAWKETERLHGEVEMLQAELQSWSEFSSNQASWLSNMNFKILSRVDH